MKSISDIPVLFFPFSRPKYARQVFEAIKKAQPKKFYFYCDKAREGNEEEKKNNEIIRAYIDEVYWDCDLKTWFRDENIGVYKSILDAIDWFFEKEEFGIILEEDTVPSMAFFDFCRQLLPKYKNDYRVWLISGNNFIEGYNPSGYDYIFSNVLYQWGWATWSSRWKKINRDGFNVYEMIRYKLNWQYFGNRKAAKYTDKELIRNMDENGIWKPPLWDYIFQLSMRCEGGFGIVPKFNLVSNIGVIGTHSNKKNKIFHERKILESLDYNIEKHPPYVVPDFQYSLKMFKKILLKKDSIFQKILRCITKLKFLK
ncbi:glycosyltransferase family protein [Calditrichota bacterium LG25]